MGTTDNFAHPYPDSGDPADVPADLQALAESVDSKTMILQAKKSIVPAEQSRTNTAYGYLGTNDKVTGIVLPTDGLIVVAFQALWKEDTSGEALAALFIGANQQKVQASAAGGTLQPVTVEAISLSTADEYRPVFTTPTGLASMRNPVGSASSDVTTGQAIGYAGINSSGTAHLLSQAIDGEYAEQPIADGSITAGGPCHIFAAAGTYEVGVKFKSASGTVTAKERKLWVYTIAFD